MTEQRLMEEVFQLMFLCEGTGLGMSYNDVMDLDVPVKDKLLELLYDRMDSLRQAYENLSRKAR